MYTRRELGKLALATLPVAGLLPKLAATASGWQRPDSKVAGVQIGLNVPYNFGNAQLPADEILKNTLQLGVSGLELRAQPVEVFMGARPELIFPPGRGGRNAPQLTPEQQATQAAARKIAAEDLRKWRTSASLDQAKALRARYNSAGVLIEVVKVDGIFTMADDVLDYFFTLARTLGARAISTEIASNLDDTKRVGQFADKHKLMVGYHGHATTTPAHWETTFGFAKFNGANLDIGHFIAGNNTSPVPFLKTHHARISHIHVKDRKLNNGPNTPFGEGDTPIKEVLQLIRDNKWNIQATIEFEYQVPAGSDRMAEMAKCVQYCREALK